MAIKHFDFYFDVGSPYSYLAASQVPGIVERTGITAVWRPLLLGGIFHGAENQSPNLCKAKARWIRLDLKMWAKHYDLPMRQNSAFPVNTLMAQRLLVAAQQLHDNTAVQTLAKQFFQAMWVDDKDLGESVELEACLQRAGLDVAQMMHASTESDIKNELRRVSDEAVTRGTFGAPTFFIGRQMFWGNDRLHLLEHALLNPDVTDAPLQRL